MGKKPSCRSDKTSHLSLNIQEAKRLRYEILSLIRPEEFSDDDDEHLSFREPRMVSYKDLQKLKVEVSRIHQKRVRESAP